MSKQSDVYEKILQKYPRVFAGGNTIELYNVGWADIIDYACFIINQELESLPEEIAQGIHASQIKTKFGGLRFYMSHDTPLISGVIQMAEAISLSTCEMCGDKGSPITIGSWTFTLCPKHRDEEEVRVAAEHIRYAKEHPEEFIWGEEDINEDFK